ncbi:helix-turn-helix domain-containing protein [Peptococcus simiae]|uniref:helix-turn-helix domain-containing protein n=1 Tax=Peptococcus simiae TaxID=1643805 RepID=UPI003980EA93
MELGSQIKKYRTDRALSQEALAEKLYVSRQTISNWENDKSYPDAKSLLLLSDVLQTSIDHLIKGDVEIMKERVAAEDKRDFERAGKIYGALLLITVLSMIPLIRLLGGLGEAVWLLLMAATLGAAFLVEKKKKQYDIQTYKEVIAFSEGTKLDDLEKMKEEAKRPYQKVLFAVLSGLLIFLVLRVVDLFF